LSLFGNVNAKDAIVREHHEPRIGHGMMTKSRPGNFNGNSFVEKSARAARELAVAMKMLARLNSRPPPPRKVA